MPIERDPSCCRDLNWRLTIPASLSVDEIIRRLIARGWRDASTASFVRVLEGAAGHQLVLVPRTRRVQLRLDFMVPAETRAAVAQELDGELIESLRD